TAEGHAFSADNEWIREFEDAFEYSETEDQELAIVDVKRDMETQQPMDRLLCGDVGYGKTEVAMRAAFKAISDNKQVAVLAPTTVLVFQHYETFKQRFAAFPVSIEMISRFRSAKQQKEILQKVEAGKIDILIGTHRLLSKDVKFADLGLLVVDEEQRFGVRHKERIKQMRKQVDVLTMSATPIPRTLHMSLLGLRDMSVIETPPKDRLAIQTVVAHCHPEIIKAAIELGVGRGAQVCFLQHYVDRRWSRSAKTPDAGATARLKQVSELGAGFKIAALDRELGGAGNLLGGEQHGHINAVGFDMYVRMLEETVRELKGEEAPLEIHSTLNLGLDIRIPPEYIGDENQRLRVYKRIAGAGEPAARDSIEKELADRYGPVPEAVRNLLEYSTLKALAEKLGVETVDRRQGVANVKFHRVSKVNPDKLMRLVGRTAGAQFTPAGVLRLPLDGLDDAAAILERLRKSLAELA